MYKVEIKMKDGKIINEYINDMLELDKVVSKYYDRYIEIRVDFTGKRKELKK